ncbi:fibronectin type III domain-containing protein [Desulfogranum mediterraneum]|uniref:hypothetical protein n=1 Tax=Desulfogranum mediterraneum TaxID=160661 RepID=UPI00041C3C30|nr:hypothetical protein [Desulfogranum mediterraneum]
MKTPPPLPAPVLPRHGRPTGPALAVLLPLLLALLLCLPGTSPAQTGASSQPKIKVELQAAAKNRIYHRVAVLPVRADETAPGEAPSPALLNELSELSSLLYQELDRTNKYLLIAADEALDREASPGGEADDVGSAAVAMGKRLKARGVVSSQLSRKPSAVGALSPKASSQLRIRLLDIATTQAAWTITITAPEEATDQKTLQTGIVKGCKLLLEELIQRGAVFSPRIQPPTVLSKEGRIRGARVVLHPSPSYIHSSYQLLRADSATAVFHPVDEAVANDSGPLILEDRKLKDATSYYYTVIGLDQNGLANIPQRPFTITTTGAPLPVRKFKATGSGLRQIPLSWELASDPNVTGYAIYRATQAAGPFTKIVELDDSDQQSYVDRGQAHSYERYGKLRDNTTYYYTIRSRNRVELESPDSPVTSALTKGGPSAPTRLKAQDNQARRVSLSWRAGNDPHIKGYALFRASRHEGPFTLIASIDGRLTQGYVDSGSFNRPLADNSRYYYRLQAINVVDVSSPDSQITSGLTKPVPAAVAGVVPSRQLVKKVELSWQANQEKDIRAYEIYRGELADNLDQRVGTVAAGQHRFKDGSLGDGQSYWYAVRAIDHDGLKGKFSPAVRATTKPRPAPPVGLEVEQLEQGLRLQWQHNREEDIARYLVISVGFLNQEVGQTATNTLLLKKQLEQGKEYRFQVMAVDRDGLRSDHSTTASIRLEGTTKPQERPE